MKTLVKLLNLFEWISAGIGILFILLAVIGVLFKVSIFGFKDMLSFILAANTFFTLAIVLFLLVHFGQFKKE